MSNATLTKHDDGTWQVQGNTTSPSYVDEADYKPADYLLLQVDSELQVDFASAGSIAIAFPAFNDGRALSLAVLVRRAGYTGELRAVGAIHQDILHYIARCGFSTIELPAEVDAELALALMTPYSDHYQASVTEPAPAYQRGQRG